MNTPVKFELAKLLKEKGFDKPTHKYRQKSAVIGDNTILPLVTRKTPYDWNNYSSEVPYYSIPTIAEAVMWLYEKHGIWIQSPFPYNNGKWEWIIFLLNEPLKDTDGYKNVMSLHHEPYKFSSPTEAYEAAIEYTLKDLI